MGRVRVYASRILDQRRGESCARNDMKRIEILGKVIEKELTVHLYES